MKSLDEMSDAELRDLAVQSLSGTQEQVTEEPVVKAEEAEKTEEVVYCKEIDLGDGSGVQVFEAPTMEALIDKLAEAQKHATRKIREQAQALKEKEKPVAEPELTAEQKWLLQQRMVTEPDKVIGEHIDKEFQKKYGDRIQQLEAAEIVRKGESTAAEWVDANTNYFANERNGDRMKKYLKTYQLDITADNLQKAFEDLNASGLLEAKPEKETNAETEVETAPVRRIVEPTVTTTTVRRKVVGGISTKRSAPPVEKTAPGLTEADLYKLPMDELERLTRQELQRR